MGSLSDDSLPPLPPTKEQLKQALLEALEASFRVLEQAYADAREGATHDEAKPENDKGLVLLGKRSGDECELSLGGRRRELEIIWVE